MEGWGGGIPPSRVTLTHSGEAHNTTTPASRQVGGSSDKPADYKTQKKKKSGGGRYGQETPVGPAAIS